jgi:hypothetical protein
MGEVDERYKRGMIYTIRNINDETMIYVGSTINTLPKRFYRHKMDCKLGNSLIKLYNHIADNDWTNWYIELYENFPCNSKKELERREGQVIREIGTINKYIAGRTFKEWCEDNAEKIKENYKKYYEGNRDRIIEMNKKYSERNVEKKKEYDKKRREDNKEELSAKRKEKVCCEICGAFSTKTHLKRHQRTQKCLSIANK